MLVNKKELFSIRNSARTRQCKVVTCRKVIGSEARNNPEGAAS